MVYYYVYKILFEDGHYYIGRHRTNNLDDGYSGSGTKLIQFKEEHPEIGWQKIILCFCENKGELQVKENEYVGTLHIDDPMCLNMVCGGGGTNEGKPVSEEARNKMSKAHKGKPTWNKGKTGIYSEETKKKLSDGHKGLIPWNKGTKGIQPPSFLGKHHSEETKKKLSYAASHRSEETKRKISESLKGKPSWIKGKHLSEAAKEKDRQSHLGKKASEETKRKLSEMRRGKPRKPCSEETKEKLRQANLGKHHSEESKRKMSKTRTGRHWKLIDGKRVYY